MSQRTIVVAGGALSGPTAAARAREVDEEARIVLIERSRRVSYAVCGLAYHLSGEVGELEALNSERAAYFEQAYRVEVRTGTAVEAIEPDGRTVRLQDGEELQYDALVYALGAASRVPRVLGGRPEGNVCCFRRLSDLEAILRRLEGGGRRVAVVGGGFFGVEAADGFARRGCRVTLVERARQILPRFDRTMAETAAAALEELGVEVLTGAEVAEARREGGLVRGLRLAGSDREVEVDLVVAAAGLRPRTELLGRAGVLLLADDTVLIDDGCQTSLQDIYACGVCVSVPHAVTGRPVWLAQAAEADKTAQVAGARAAGAEVRRGPTLGTAIVRAGERTLARTGLTLDEARLHLHAEPGWTVVHAPSHERYWPDARPVTILLVYDDETGRILGAEATGTAGVAKRIDVLATAVRLGMTTEELGDLDLACAAPYAPARDPVNVAGTVGEELRRNVSRAWSVEEVAAAGDHLLLVDVGDEPSEGPGDVHLPLAELRGRLDELANGRTCVFLSESGRSAFLASRIARQRGLEEAGFLAGGLRWWRAARLEGP